MAPMKKPLAPSIVTARDPKGLKFASIVEAAYNKAKLSEAEAQRVNDTPGLSDLISTFIAENRSTDKFKDEEVKSSYGYLSGYKPGVRGLNEQCNQLRILFPGIGFANREYQEKVELGQVDLPDNAEGWFAIPNWAKNPDIFGKTYSEALLKVFATIKKARDGDFVNYREGQIDEKRLCQSARTQEFFKKLCDEQGNPDILIVPAQFGIRHRGRSVRRAREVMLDSGNEFGLGAFAVGIMILTHPERLKHSDDLWIDCAGDEYAPDADGDFSRAPGFKFSGGSVGFGTGYVCSARAVYGSASGLASQ
jgi:hypothetical protein